MTVSNITSATNPYQPTGAQNTFRSDFKALQSALGSGDLSSAQQAFATLQQDNPNFVQAMLGGNSSTQTNPVSAAFQSLQSALKSGDLTGAQNAFTSLTQALQSAHKTHHGHRGQGIDADGDRDGSQASSGSASGTTSSLASGSLNALA